MKGLVLSGNRQASFKTFPKPRPGPGEAVVQMRAAAICGSDLHFYRSRPEFIKVPGVIAGHEGSGVVAQIGSHVTNVQVGDRVSIYHYLSCGHCEHCLAGNKMLCRNGQGLGLDINGTDAPYVLVKADNCLLLPDDLSDIDGVFISCIGGTAYSSLKKLSSKQQIVIFGLGPVGLSILLLAKAQGSRVIGVEPVAARRHMAISLGIDDVIDNQSTDCVQALADLTNGKGPDRIIETSGHSGAQRDAVEAACPQAELVLVGVSERQADGRYRNEMNTLSMIAKELHLLGSYVMPYQDYPGLVRLIQTGKVDFSRIVSHRVPFDQAVEAFQLFDQGQIGKVIFEFTDTE